MVGVSGNGQATPISGDGTILERLRIAKKSGVSEAVGKSDSWAQKVFEGESGVLVHDMHAFLHALGLKVVDTSAVAVDAAVFNALRAIAGAALDAPHKLEAK